MYTYIYKHKGKYWRELTDLLGLRISIEEIPPEEYVRYFTERGGEPVE